MTYESAFAPQTIAREMPLDAVQSQVRFRGRERGGHEFHYERIGVQPLKGQPVGLVQGSQEESLGCEALRHAERVAEKNSKTADGQRPNKENEANELTPISRSCPSTRRQRAKRCRQTSEVGNRPALPSARLLLLLFLFYFSNLFL